MNITDPILANAARTPGAIAVITPKGRLSWHELERLIWSSAKSFHDQGLGPGARVGVSLSHPVMHLVAALGLARLGIAHVALPASEPDASRRSIAGKLGLDASIVDTGASVAIGLPEIVFNAQYQSVPDATERARLSWTGDTTTWLLLQSSGTTGQPKFAELSHASAMARFRRYLRMFNTSENDVFWPISRPDFVVAKQRAVHALQAGAALCLPVGVPISPAIIPFLRDSGVTLACGTPSHLHQLLALGAGPEAVPSLRVFEVRSATISEPLRAAFKANFCPGLHVVYGTNEGEALAMASPALQQQVPSTVGTPTDEIEIQVVDADGQPLPAGITGEIRVRGPGVVTTYVDNPQASAKSFVQGWFYPGDMGWISSEGAVVLQGRKDDMMIFDGMNIYPAEIENALLEHPAVHEAAAFSMPHKRFQDVPAAAVILRTAIPEAELIKHCQGLIGIRSPRVIRIVADFPRNAMGKILKRKLSSPE